MYKTIVLQLLEHHPEIYDRLRRHRTLQSTLEHYAHQLKANQEAWENRLFQAKPGSDASQITSESLEPALKQLEENLSSRSPTEEAEPLSLEGAMAFIRRHTPPA